MKILYNGQVNEATTLPAIVGSICTIHSKGNEMFFGEVVGVRDSRVDILPYDSNLDIRIGDDIFLTEMQQEVEVGENLLGRVIDGFCNPLDGQGDLNLVHRKKINGINVNPFERRPIKEVLDVGIRNINSLLTVGRGQRLGIVAGSGVGKSILLSMITKSTDADVVVVSLIGERGRELATFTEEILNSHSKEKVVVVAVPADRSPLLAHTRRKRATTISEYFRDEGKNVLLITDLSYQGCPCTKRIRTSARGAANCSRVSTLSNIINTKFNRTYRYQYHWFRHDYLNIYHFSGW